MWGECCVGSSLFQQVTDRCVEACACLDPMVIVRAASGDSGVTTVGI
ncbi:hypothetical protein HMPREF0970_01671 [Schaalia odontolytica F0309]|uniref:Uncharacterized protein n=1 Tax=Schaalia odontolytica F0309 TaxID=649742 RepID=D4U0D1_9ACTO|nr:hypothetical protein HMPREF0970_01671 [Schaalia odontolytica F0309]